MSSPMAQPLPWDLVSDAYEAEITPQFEAYARRAIELAQVPRNSRVVDIATGPGTLAMLASAAGHTVDALDFSPKMIERLTARIALLRANVTPQLGDGQALPYEDGTFAAAFSMFGLMFFPDRDRGFAELRRVLAQGGRAVVASWEPLDKTPLLAAVYGALPAVLAAAGMPSSLPPARLGLETVEQCRAEMGAHLTDVEVHAIHHTKQWANGDELWASMKRSFAPFVLMQNKLPPPAWQAVDRELGRIVREHAPGDGKPIEVTMHALLSVGTAGPKS
jgi:SAM-dependent methyltransferase